MFLILTAIGLLGAVTGKIASRRGRFAPFWILYGAALFPVAIVHLLLAKPIVPCPACGRGRKEDARCGRCGYEDPRPMEDALAQHIIVEILGFSLGENFEAAVRKIERAGLMYGPEEEGACGPNCNLVVYQREIFGHNADIVLDFDGETLAQVRAVYPNDRNYAIYYDLRAHMVSQYGKPDFGNFDDGYCDNWTAESCLLSLSTDHCAGGKSTTTLSCLRLEPPLCDALAQQTHGV